MSTTELIEGGVLGSWELLKPIGSGGQGELWKAADRRGALVAIKVAKPGGTTAVQREQALGAVHHPTLVEVLGSGVADGGRPYVVYEYVEGSSLADLLRPPRRFLPPGVAVGIALDLCEAIDALHGAEVLHLDIKPSNILVSPAGRVRLGDYGAATGIEEKEPRAFTLGYCAPEQLQGTRQVSRASDWWAFAVVFFEMVNGHRPFSAGDDEVYLGAALAGTRAKWPPHLEQVFGRLLSEDRTEKHWETAVDWLRLRCGERWRTELRAWISQLDTNRSAHRTRRRQAALAASCAIGIASVAAIATPAWTKARPVPSSAPPKVRVDKPAPPAETDHAPPAPPAASPIAALPPRSGLRATSIRPQAQRDRADLTRKKASPERRRKLLQKATVVHVDESRPAHELGWGPFDL